MDNTTSPIPPKKSKAQSDYKVGEIYSPKKYLCVMLFLQVKALAGSPRSKGTVGRVPGAGVTAREKRSRRRKTERLAYDTMKCSSKSLAAQGFPGSIPLPSVTHVSSPAGRAHLVQVSLSEVASCQGGPGWMLCLGGAPRGRCGCSSELITG